MAEQSTEIGIHRGDHGVSAVAGGCDGGRRISWEGLRRIQGLEKLLLFFVTTTPHFCRWVFGAVEADFSGWEAMP